MITELQRRRLQRKAPSITIEGGVVVFSRNGVETAVAVIREANIGVVLEMNRSYDFTAAELLALAERFAEYEDSLEVTASLRNAIQEARGAR